MVERLEVSAFTIPTSSPEADGTLSSNSTTIVTVSVTAGGPCSLGYAYADVSTAHLVDSLLKPIVVRKNSLHTAEIWRAADVRLMVDAALRAQTGVLRPDPHLPGLGLELKTQDIERYRVYGNADS